MITEKIGSHTVRLYQGVDETPILNDVLSNKYALIDNQIGSGVAKIEEHILKASKLNAHGDKKAVQTELENLNKCVSLTKQGLNMEHLAFAALTESIDGKKVYDHSEDSLNKMLLSFSRWGLTSGRLSRILSDIKKKMKLS